jgi:uncharacterized DUF497 family protein
MEFEWDSSKAAANLKKHGVSFEEAKTRLATRNEREDYEQNAL